MSLNFIYFCFALSNVVIYNLFKFQHKVTIKLLLYMFKTKIVFETDFVWNKKAIPITY